MIKQLSLVSLTFLLFGALRAQSPLEMACNLKATQTPLIDCLFQLMDDCDAPISFPSALIPEKQITLQLQETPLKNILQQLLEGTSIQYELDGSQILLIRKRRPVKKKYYTLSGFIVDKRSGEPLYGANIFDEKSGKGTVANEYGFYSLTLKEGDTQLRITYVGNESKQQSLLLKQHTEFNVELNASLELPAVVVTPKDSLLQKNRKEISTFDLPPEAVDQLPTLAGEPDLMRLTHLLPGIQTGADGVGGIFVRGGSTDQNLILVDGVPVYNVFHVAGMFSIFNNNAIRSAKLVKGGFPARYGGRLSSVLDIRLKEGNLKEFKGQADIGLMTGRLSLEGPIVKNKASFFISARRSLLDLYLGPISESWKEVREERGRTNYLFYDLNAKINYQISKRDKVYLSLYTGKDFFDDESESTFPFALTNSTGDSIFFESIQSYQDHFEWGNTVSALRWNHIANKKLFSNFTLTYSKLAVDIDYLTNDQIDRINLGEATTLQKIINLGRFRSSIEDIGGKLDVEFIPNSSHYIRMGVGLTQRSFVPGILFYNGIDSLEIRQLSNTISNDPIRSFEYNAYIEDQIEWSSQFSMNIGLRASNLRLENTNYGFLQPRFSFNWLPNDRWLFKGSYSRMVQYLHLLSQSGFGLPSDLWVSSTRNIPPQTAWQTVVGLEYEISNWGNFNLEAYYKEMDDLIDYTEGANVLNNWEDNVTSGTGESYGIEAMLRKTLGKTTGWISYGLAYTNRQFENINRGDPFPFRYDRRHDLKIVLSHWLTPKLQLTANWIYATGSAFSAANRKFFNVRTGDNGEILEVVEVTDFENKNEFRIKSYQRLDINANIFFNQKEDKIQHVLRLGIYNALNRTNPLYYRLRKFVEAENNQFRIVSRYVEVPMLPFLPSLNYTIKF